MTNYVFKQKSINTKNIYITPKCFFQVFKCELRRLSAANRFLNLEKLLTFSKDVTGMFLKTDVSL